MTTTASLVAGRGRGERGGQRLDAAAVDEPAVDGVAAVGADTVTAIWCGSSRGARRRPPAG